MSGAVWFGGSWIGGRKETWGGGGGLHSSKSPDRQGTNDRKTEERREEEEGRQGVGVLGMQYGPTGKTQRPPKLSQRMAHPMPILLQ